MEQSKHDKNVEVYGILQGLTPEKYYRWLDPDLLEEAVQQTMVRVLKKGDVSTEDTGLLYTILRGEISNVLYKRKLWHKVGIPFSDLDTSFQEPMFDNGDDEMDRSIKMETRRSIVDSMIAAAARSPVPGGTSKEILMRLLIEGEKTEAIAEEMNQYGDTPANNGEAQRADARIRQRVSRFTKRCRLHILESGAEDTPLLSLSALGSNIHEMSATDLVQAVLAAERRLCAIEDTELQINVSEDAGTHPQQQPQQENTPLIAVSVLQEAIGVHAETVSLINALRKNLARLQELLSSSEVPR